MVTKRILVYGGKGALGSACVSAFKAENWWVGSIDTKINENADESFIVNKENTSTEQECFILDQLKSVLGENKLDAVICVAGGWAGGNVASSDYVKNCELTYKQSVISSIVASSIASKLLNEGGLLSFTGASAALQPTPEMIGYGMAKAAVHHLTKSLATANSGLPFNTTTIAILPEILDTPMNRKWMPKADTSKWTSLEFISSLFIKWCNNVERPSNGSLIKFITKDNVTKMEIV